jgi:hypothetical protein
MHTARSLFGDKETSRGLHVLLTSERVITFFGGTPSLKCNLRNEVSVISLIKGEITATPDSMVREGMRTSRDRLEQV